MPEFLVELDGLTALMIAAKAGGYLCALVAAGTVAFTTLASRHAVMLIGVRRLAALAALAGLLLVGGQIALRASFLGGSTVSAALDPMLLGLVTDSQLGTASVVRAAGLAAVLLLPLDLKLTDLLAGIGGLAVAGSFALAGHALGEPRWALALLVTVHTGALAYWIAALPGLLLATRQVPQLTAAGLFDAFGRSALAVVGVLAVAGGLLAWLLIGSLQALWTSDYALLLLVKLLVVAGLLGLAARNKLTLTPRVLAGDPDALAALRASVRFELGAVVLILTLTAALTTLTAPPA
jgi:putative copper resistance protein D